MATLLLQLVPMNLFNIDSIIIISTAIIIAVG